MKIGIKIKILGKCKSFKIKINIYKPVISFIYLPLYNRIPDLILGSLFLPLPREAWVALLCPVQDILCPFKWPKHLIVRDCHWALS